MKLNTNEFEEKEEIKLLSKEKKLFYGIHHLSNSKNKLVFDFQY